MTTEMAYELNNSNTKKATIIPFPLSNTVSKYDPTLESLLVDAFKDPEVESHLKGIVEAAVFDAWLRTGLTDLVRRDNPFDAVYISELRADIVTKSDSERILKFFEIRDLSDSIQFKDGWDD